MRQVGRLLVVPVYVIKMGDLDLYKVGWSLKPEARRRDLQVANPFTLTVVALFDGDRSAERRIHQALRRDRQVGEWFQLTETPTPEQLATWAKPLAPDAPEDLSTFPWEDRLGVLRDRIAELETALAEARRVRDDEVRACHRDGLKPADIARAAGISRQAVYDIINTSS